MLVIPLIVYSRKPFAMKYSNDGGNSFTTYYYVLNLQGDVVMMLDQDGNVAAEYAYSAWGQLRRASGRMAFTNPLRYRGYYYDSETGFYYLQSRYYDPSLHRFINADGYASTGQGFIGNNMFAYCNNNPIMYADYSGKSIDDVTRIIADAYKEVLMTVSMSFMLRKMGFQDYSYASARDCVRALEKSEINTVEEKAHFFAQCYAEGSLSTLEAGWLSYEAAERYRKGQEYYPYYGAGYIQLTWEENYKAFSEYMGDPKIYSEGPQYVADNYAWSSAGWFWTTNNINDIIANNGSVEAVTRAVNGGLPDNFDLRVQCYKTFLGYFGE